MTKSIWKFPLKVNDLIEVEMPIGAQILTVQAQDDIPSIWAAITIGAKKEKRNFQLFGTGHVTEMELGQYIGTFQLHSGMLVFHLFEIIKHG